MVALSTDIQRILSSGSDYRPRHLPVLTNVAIFDGAGLCTHSTSGKFVTPIVIGLTAPLFAGFARESANNNPGASGAKNVLVGQQGTLTIPNTTAFFAAGVLTIANKDAILYMNDDGTGFTLTVGAAGTLAVGIGKISNVLDGYVMVEYQADSMRSI